MGNPEIVPYPPHRSSVTACGRHVRRVVSRLQVAVQQRIDPDVGTPRPACCFCLRRGTGRGFGRGGLRGGHVQRLFWRPGLHDVATDLPGVGLLSDHDAVSVLRRRTRRRSGRGQPYRLLAGRGPRDVRILPPSGGRPRHRDTGPVLWRGVGRRPGHDGMLGGHLQCLLRRPGPHNVAIEPPGVGVLSDRDAEQWHRPSLYWAPGPTDRRRPPPWSRASAARGRTSRSTASRQVRRG